MKISPACKAILEQCDALVSPETIKFKTVKDVKTFAKCHGVTIDIALNIINLSERHNWLKEVRLEKKPIHKTVSRFKNLPDLMRELT